MGEPKDGGDQVFVHRKVHGDGTDRTAYLEEGDEVEYETEWDDRKGKYSCSSCTGFKTGGNTGGGKWGGGGGDKWGGDRGGDKWGSGGDKWGSGGDKWKSGGGDKWSSGGGGGGSRYRPY